jgi:hypothetical protein
MTIRIPQKSTSVDTVMGFKILSDLKKEASNGETDD